MTAYEEAIARLRAIRDAVNALDLASAAGQLVEHDRRLREAMAVSPPALAVAEAEALSHAQAELLAQLEAVQRGVATDLQQARRGHTAARAYLGHTGG